MRKRANTRVAKFFFFSSRRRHTRSLCDWSSDVCSSDLRSTPTSSLANPFSPLDPGPGNLLELNGTFKYKPTDALTLSLDYTKSRLVRHDTGRVAFDENIYTLRSTRSEERRVGKE